MSFIALRHVGSSRTRARTPVPCVGRRFLTTEPPGKPLEIISPWSCGCHLSQQYFGLQNLTHPAVWGGLIQISFWHKWFHPLPQAGLGTCGQPRLSESWGKGGGQKWEMSPPPDFRLRFWMESNRIMGEGGGWNLPQTCYKRIIVLRWVSFTEM